jgi:hypothetical protein
VKTKLQGAIAQGAVAGGVITYTAKGSQKVAVAAGMTSTIWPTEQTTAQIVILGLGEPPKKILSKTLAYLRTNEVLMSTLRQPVG